MPLQREPHIASCSLVHLTSSLHPTTAIPQPIPSPTGEMSTCFAWSMAHKGLTNSRTHGLTERVKFTASYNRLLLTTSTKTWQKYVCDVTSRVGEECQSFHNFETLHKIGYVMLGVTRCLSTSKHNKTPSLLQAPSSQRHVSKTTK